MNQHAIDQRRQTARALRDHDRAVAAAIAVRSLQDAIRETDARPLADRIAGTRRAIGFSSWSLRAHGSHR